MPSQLVFDLALARAAGVVPWIISSSKHFFLMEESLNNQAILFVTQFLITRAQDDLNKPSMLLDVRSPGHLLVVDRKEIDVQSGTE